MGRDMSSERERATTAGPDTKASIFCVTSGDLQSPPESHCGDLCSSCSTNLSMVSNNLSTTITGAEQSCGHDGRADASSLSLFSPPESPSNQDPISRSSSSSSPSSPFPLLSKRPPDLEISPSPRPTSPHQDSARHLMREVIRSALQLGEVGDVKQVDGCNELWNVSTW